GPGLAPSQDPERGGPDLPVLPEGWPLVARVDPPAPGEARPRDVIDGTGSRRGPEDVAPDRGSLGAARGGPQAPGGGGGGGDSAVAAFAMLDALFVRAPVGLALLDRTGRFVRVNEALTRLDRRSARDHLGRTASEVLGDSDSELDALLARVLRTGEAVVDLEVGVAGPAGTPLTWLASWFPVTDPQLGPVGVSFVALDVTGRQIADRERLRAQARYRGLVDAAGVDVFHAAADGALDVDLPGWRSATGQQPGTLAGSGWLSGVHPVDRDRVARLWRGAVERGEAFEAEFRISAPTGVGGAERVVTARVLPVSGPGSAVDAAGGQAAGGTGPAGDGRPVEWLGVIRDLTGERAAEAARAEADRRTEAAVEQAEAASQRAESGGLFSVALARASTVDEVVAAILDVGGQAARAAGRGVALVDDRRLELRFAQASGDAPQRPGSWPDVALGAVHPLAEVVRGARPLFLADRGELLARWPVSDLADAAVATGEQAWAMLPLVALDGSAFGVVTFAFPAPRTFTAADRAYLSGLAAAAARALERARAHERLVTDAAQAQAAITTTNEEREARERADRRLRLLARATEIVTSADAPERSLRAVAELIAAEIADLCVVHLVTARPALVPPAGPIIDGGEQPAETEPAGHPEPMGEAGAATESGQAGTGGQVAVPELRPLVVAGSAAAGAAPSTDAWIAALASPSNPISQVAARGVGEVVSHAALGWEPPSDLARWIRQVGAHTTAVLPVVRVGRIAAVFSLTAAGDRAPFVEADLAFLTELAARAGVALEGIERERSARDGAAELHETLRGAAPTVPAGLQVASRYLPAGAEGDAGGEWFDVIDLGAGRAALVIGGVRGRGLRTSAAMGQLRAAARACARLDLPPGEVLALLDGVVADMPGHEVATCIYAIAELDTGVLTLASAGHPPPLVVAPDGLVSRLYMAVGSPLGEVRRDPAGHADATEYTVRLGRGYLIALFTAGLVRGGGRDVDAGVSDLAAVLARYSDAPADNLDPLATAACAGLGRDGQPAPADDAAALLIARLPDEPTTGPALLDVTVDGPTGLHAVRAQCRLALENAELPAEIIDTVVLVLSELTSNAVRHGRPPLSVRLRRLGDRAVVEVADGGGRLPRRRQASPDDEAGRGLDLVSRLAVRHGFRPIPDGKVVWAEVDLVTSPPAGPVVP
uniref:SpoIIE family protein phosphatase n=1 Tax=Frankia tisae TaxID=2950104 RepID=UPI0021C1A0BE